MYQATYKFPSSSTPAPATHVAVLMFGLTCTWLSWLRKKRCQEPFRRPLSFRRLSGWADPFGLLTAAMCTTPSIGRTAGCRCSTRTVTSRPSSAVLQEALERVPVRLLAYCVMPNHWHLVLWPRKDGDLSRFVGWLSLTHTQRWHAHRHSAGTGHVYQGRFKSFPVQEDDHLLTLCRYVERNALRSGLVRKAELWRWGSLWRRESGTEAQAAILSPWPIGPLALGGDRQCRANAGRG